MNTIYFSEREHGPKPRTVEQIAISAWGGIVAAIRSRIADGSFGYRYPDKCPDGGAVSGCDNSLFMMAMKAEFPDFLDIEGFSEEVLPDTLVALDLLEFCYRVVAKPIPGGYHSFYRHDHLSFDPEEGQKLFRIDINRILARNSLVFEINPNGQVIRLAPPVLR
ncbi:MAG: hypothetical protein HYY31_01960, partial [Chloroflexi bacterium]|nr:hypothetical protein [Chloroflexota bacterium]